jgi:ribosome maturation factor RimP
VLFVVRYGLRSTRTKNAFCNLKKVGFVPLSFVVGVKVLSRKFEDIILLTAREQKLLEQLEPRAQEAGIEIVYLEVVGPKKSPIIRVYIDTEGGVDFDVILQAQAWMGEFFDEIDPFPGAYTLEVSSPGIDRPLRTPEHFKRYCGCKVNVRTQEPIDGRSNYKGKLLDANSAEITVEVDDIQTVIPFNNIKKANLIGEIEF